jgi:hypothetical protein
MEAFGTRVIGTEDVHVTQLDQVLMPAAVAAPALLKIDTQGYELQVLQGCGELLGSFDAVYAELSYVELYQGQPLAGEIVVFMQDSGFRTVGVLNQASDVGGRPLQADCLIAKSGVNQCEVCKSYSSDDEAKKMQMPIAGDIDAMNSVITGRHVLEHLPDPVGTLKRRHSLMADGDRIIVEPPNFESAEARLFRSTWAGLYIPRILIHFLEAYHVGMLEHVGFSVERARPVFLASSISESLLRCVAGLFARSIFYNKIGWLAYLLLTVPGSLSYLLGNRGIIQVVARKRDVC